VTSSNRLDFEDDLDRNPDLEICWRSALFECFLICDTLLW